MRLPVLALLATTQLTCPPDRPKEAIIGDSRRALHGLAEGTEAESEGEGLTEPETARPVRLLRDGFTIGGGSSHLVAPLQPVVEPEVASPRWTDSFSSTEEE